MQNVALDRFAPELLFYDDDPEHVTQDGVFFRGSISAGRPTRLYYYHDNTQDPRRLVLALRANSQDPTQVQVVDSTSGPNADVMHVGHTVTQKYLLAKQRGQAIVLDLTDSPYFLQDITMGARDLVAGSARLPRSLRRSGYRNGALRLARNRPADPPGRSRSLPATDITVPEPLR